jgi:hypothetical protein
LSILTRLGFTSWPAGASAGAAGGAAAGAAFLPLRLTPAAAPSALRFGAGELMLLRLDGRRLLAVAAEVAPTLLLPLLLLLLLVLQLLLGPVVANGTRQLLWLHKRLVAANEVTKGRKPRMRASFSRCTRCVACGCKCTALSRRQGTLTLPSLTSHSHLMPFVILSNPKHSVMLCTALGGLCGVLLPCTHPLTPYIVSFNLQTSFFSRSSILLASCVGFLQVHAATFRNWTDARQTWKLGVS